LSFTASSTATLPAISASQMIQRNGWTTNLAYNSAGQLTQITNHFGRSLLLSYNSNGLLNQITQPDGGIVSYEYDSAQRNIRVGYPGNSYKQYLYERADLPQALTGILDENATRLSTYTYDAQGRASGTQYAGGAGNYQLTYTETAPFPPAACSAPPRPIPPSSKAPCKSPTRWATRAASSSKVATAACAS
jgi:YD repeat-containing protein